MFNVFFWTIIAIVVYLTIRNSLVDDEAERVFWLPSEVEKQQLSPNPSSQRLDSDEAGV